MTEFCDEFHEGEGTDAGSVIGGPGADAEVFEASEDRGDLVGFSDLRFLEMIFASDGELDDESGVKVTRSEYGYFLGVGMDKFRGRGVRGCGHGVCRGRVR